MNNYTGNNISVKSRVFWMYYGTDNFMGNKSWNLDFRGVKNIIDEGVFGIKREVISIKIGV